MTEQVEHKYKIITSYQLLQLSSREHLCGMWERASNLPISWSRKLLWSDSTR